MAETTGPVTHDEGRPPVHWPPRVAGLVVAWLAWTALVVGVFGVMGYAGVDGGWAWAALALAPLVLLTRWVLKPAGRPRRTTIAASAITVILGVVVYLSFPASVQRVDRVSQGLPVPSDAVEVWVDAVPSAWCLETCSYVERGYTVPDSDTALAALTAGLEDRGWQHQGSRWCHGGFSVQVARASNDDPRLAAALGQNPDLQAIKVITKAGC